MNISDWLRHARGVLHEAGCPDPAVDARWMVEDTLGMTRADIKFEGEKEVHADVLQTLNAMLARRAQGEPVQYILGRADFMGLPFYVDHRVLIPRPETEGLVEQALVAFPTLPGSRVLDLCAGSGCIGLSIKSLCPKAEVTLSDVSRDALEVAKKNADRLSLQVSFKHGDLFKAAHRQRFDLIVSNPPYIPRGALPELQREVRYEPVVALDGGRDGLETIRRIAEDLPNHLNPGGMVYLEVGIHQARAALDLLCAHVSWQKRGIVRDLNGIERIIWLRSV